jgi:hypothetical protein
MDENQTAKMLNDLHRIAINLDRMAHAAAIDASCKVRDMTFHQGVGDSTIQVLQSAEDLRRKALDLLVHSYQRGS